MISDLILNGELLITDSGSGLELQTIPKWVEFMIWAGWKMHLTKPDARYVMVLLLPERYCCSAFCSFGAILAGSATAHSSFRWDDFSELESGDTIFLIYKNEGKPLSGEATVGDFYENDPSSGRWVNLITKRKRHCGAKFLINKNNIESFQISKERHISQIRLGRLNKLSKFLNAIVDGYQQSWIVGNSIESVIVTNKADWLRHMEDVNIAINGLSRSIKNRIELRELLMLGDCENSSSSHTRVVSSVSTDEVNKNPLTILDGPDALARWENHLQGNIIVLLSRAEYTEEAENIISMLSSCRMDDLALKPEFDPAKIIPGDSEMALFALPMT